MRQQCRNPDALAHEVDISWSLNGDTAEPHFVIPTIERVTPGNKIMNSLERPADLRHVLGY